MPKKVRDVSGALKRKGFLEEMRDHRYYVFYRGGKKTSINTKISHGETEISDGLLGKMARQMHLSRLEFDSFVECTLSEEKYTKKMIEKKVLE